MHYTYQFRLYPTKKQEIKLAKHFGSQRFIYNYFLNKRQERYGKNEKSSYHKDAKELTSLKQEKEHKWLYDVSHESLQQSLMNLDTAYQRFFKKQSDFPKFKKRKGKQSFHALNRIIVKNNKLYINHFREGIKIKQHRQIEGRIINATVSKKPCGHYYVSITVEKEIPIHEENTNIVGIDLGIKDLAITSDGTKYENIKPYRKLEKKIKRLSRKHSKKQKDSKNREKARKKLARLHERVENIRNNHLHQITYKIVRENQVIILEDLNVSGMMKNHKLAKSVADVSLYEFTRQIQYKSAWYGRQVIFISRWFPSSKTCNCCGHVNHDLTLDDREWTCPCCKTLLDRDINAAINIKREGLRILNDTVGITEIQACGDNVRPKIMSDTRLLSEKQEIQMLKSG